MATFKTVINNQANNSKPASWLIGQGALRFSENYPERGYKEGQVATVYILDDEDVIEIYNSDGVLLHKYEV